MYRHLDDANCFDDLQHECKDHLDLRSRCKGTGTAYAYQCQFCGQFVGQELSQKKISTIPPPADEELIDAYCACLKVLSDEYRASKPPRTDFPPPRPTLSQQEKDDRIRKALYKALPEDTSPEQLIKDIQGFLQRQRDTKIDTKFESSWCDEEQLCHWFYDTFSYYFDIYPEVSGKCELYEEGKQPRIDFVIRAKGMLLKHGFTDEYIGVEVKFLDPRTGHKFHRKASRSVFQAISYYWYGGTEWNVPEEREPVQLAAVLLFSNLSFHDEKEKLYNTLDQHYRKVWPSYLSIASHANVGELQILRYNDEMTKWNLDFGGDCYFTVQEQTRYREKVYRMGLKTVIGKRRLGYIT